MSKSLPSRALALIPRPGTCPSSCAVSLVSGQPSCPALQDSEVNMPPGRADLPTQTSCQGSKASASLSSLEAVSTCACERGNFRSPIYRLCKALDGQDNGVCAPACYTRRSTDVTQGISRVDQKTSLSTWNQDHPDQCLKRELPSLPIQTQRQCGCHLSCSENSHDGTLQPSGSVLT